MAIERSLHILEDYDLSQAFYLLGIRMFEDDWKGHDEIVAKNDERSADSIINKNKEIDDELQDVAEEITVLSRNQKKQADPVKSQAIKDVINGLFKKREQLYGEKIDEGVANYISSKQETYKRRIATEQVLIEALIRRKINYWAIGSLLIDNRAWEKVDGCSYSIELSCIWWGKKVQRDPRRQFIRICKSEFDLWLDKNYPFINPDDENHSKEELANSWIIEKLKKQKEHKWRRDDYIDYMMSQFGISNRKAKTIWTNHAPLNMKQAGRPKSKRSK